MKTVKAIFNKKNIITILSVTLTVLFLIMQVIDLKIKVTNNNYNLIWPLLALLVIFIITILLCNIFIRKRDMAIHKSFAIIAFIIGLLYIIVAPLFTGSDEHNHYYRIYEIASSAALITPVTSDGYVGSKLPNSLEQTFRTNFKANTSIKYADTFKAISVKLNKNVVIQYGLDISSGYENTALYSPVQYIFQIFGFIIGININLNPYIIGIIGRLFNLISCILICTYAIKKLPKNKLFVTIVLLSPIGISNISTLSADGITNSIILLFISIIYNKIYLKEKLSVLEKGLLSILSIMIALCKIVYLPLVFLLLFIPEKCFASKREKAVFLWSTIIVSIAISAFWLNITNQYFNAYYVKTEEQKRYILSNPINYIIVVFRTYLNNVYSLVNNMFTGNDMYYAQIKIPEYICISYLFIVVSSLFTEKTKDFFTKKYKIFASIISIVILALITTAIYIQCTANFVTLNNPLVFGLQGRYFIPLLFLLIPLINIKKKYFTGEYLIIVAIVLNYFTLITMLIHFI